MAQAKTARQPERDYSHRDVVDKLGIKPGFARGLRRRAAAQSTPNCAPACSPALAAPSCRSRRAGRRGAGRRRRLDRRRGSAEALARRASTRPAASGCSPPNAASPGYVDQTELILTGPAAGVVDNKICSVSDTAQRHALRDPQSRSRILLSASSQRRRVVLIQARSSSGPGRYPLKVEIAGSNPARVTAITNLKTASQGRFFVIIGADPNSFPNSFRRRRAF